VIEEQGDLPRIIWGLPTDSELVNVSDSRLTERDRLADVQVSSSQPAILVEGHPRPQTPKEHPHLGSAVQAPVKQALGSDSWYSASDDPGLDLINVGLSTGYQPDPYQGTIERELHLPSDLLRSKQQAMPHNNQCIDIHNHLTVRPSSPFPNQEQKDFDFSTYIRRTDEHGPSKNSPAGALPPIVLGPPVGQSGHAPLQLPIPIGDQHRKLQQVQLPPRMLLPTPPSSTSPVWASTFTSYTDALGSVGSFSVNKESAVQRTAHNTPAGVYYGGIQANTIGDSDFQSSKGLNIANTNFGPVLYTTSRLIPADPAIVQAIPTGGPANHLLSPTASPHPGPPPSGPLPPVPVSSPIAGPRKRSLTFQAPKSIPLAKLVGRRLASVPEVPEDIERANSSDKASATAFRRFGGSGNLAVKFKPYFASGPVGDSTLQGELSEKKLASPRAPSAHKSSEARRASGPTTGAKIQSQLSDQRSVSTSAASKPRLKDAKPTEADSSQTSPLKVLSASKADDTSKSKVEEAVDHALEVNCATTCLMNVTDIECLCSLKSTRPLRKPRAMRKKTSRFQARFPKQARGKPAGRRR
jgi:hypothetical protein